jgi:hypothetical protein
MSPKKVERIINFYHFSINDGSLIDFVSKCLILNKLMIEEKNDSRYLKSVDGGYLYMSILNQNYSESVDLQGRIMKIRMDDFPQIMHTLDDKVREIEIDELEGVVETSHFVIDKREDKLLIAMEFNQFGPKIGDLSHFFEHISSQGSFSQKVDTYPLIDEKLLDTLNDRISSCHKLIIKVKKNSISGLEEIHHGFVSGMNMCDEFGETKSFEMIINFDLKNYPGTPQARKSISKIVSYFNGKNKNFDNIEKLTLVAKDSLNNDKIELFDLLLSRIKRKVVVSRSGKSRTIVSSEMFEKLQNEIKSFKENQ